MWAGGRLRAAILEQYQEQPSLLDPALEGMVASLVAVAREYSPGAAPAAPEAAHRLLYVLAKVRGAKTLVKLFSHDAADFLGVLAQLRRVRRPSLPRPGPLVDLVWPSPRHKPLRQALETEAPWTTRYVLLLWLSLVVMLPFDMAVFDASGRAHGLLFDLLDLAQVCHRG